MRPTVLLFDVDGTLLSAGGAGRRALERAFAGRCGTAVPLHEVRFNGMTDPGIVRAGLAGLGRAMDMALATAILEDYLELLADELPRTTGFQIFPGVASLLEDLGAAANVAVGLGTGNLRDGARQKPPRRARRSLPVRGFGSDHEDRAALLRVGVTRGAAQLGCPADTCRVVVIGDTPRDVAAARAIGAASLGVGTGGCALEELRAAGATWAFEDLTAPGVRELLGKGETT